MTRNFLEFPAYLDNLHHQEERGWEGDDHQEDGDASKEESAEIRAWLTLWNREMSKSKMIEISFF